MAFTQFNMAPIVPGHSGLESIRSVAANFARTDEDDNYAEYRNKDWELSKTPIVPPVDQYRRNHYNHSGLYIGHTQCQYIVLVYPALPDLGTSKSGRCLMLHQSGWM
ncbi:MAG: hypothetical protein Q9201_000238 [Fulgogasparrea decipioides]